MSKTIKEVYDADPTNRNDPTLDGIIPGDDGANTPVAYNMDQLAGAIGHRLGPVVQDDFIVTIADNTLTANISPITGTYTHWIITVDDATTPVYGVDPFIAGAIQLTKDVAAWGTSETWRLWLYDLVLQDPPTELTAPDGTSGVTITSNATAPPIISGQFTIGSNTATTASSVVVVATVVDELTLQYDVIDTYDNNKAYESDVSVGAVTIDGLSPLTTYGFAERVSPAGDLTRAAFSNVVEITTDAIGTITAFSFTSVVDTTDVTINQFSVSDGAMTEWFYNFTGVAPTILSTWLTPLPTPTVSFIDILDYGSQLVSVWARDPNFPTGISQVATATATATESSPVNSVFSVASANIDASEEQQEDIIITVNRGNTTSGTASVDITLTAGTDGEGAVADYHYYNVSQTVNFDSAEASVDVAVPIIFRNLGHTNGTPRYKWFTATLSNPSGSNTVNSSADETTVNIYGLHKIVSGAKVGGYHTNGQIDTNSPPVNLPVTTGTTTFSSVTPTTVEYRRFDGQKLVEAGIELADGVTDLTLKDIIVDNVNLSSIRTMGASTRVKMINCVFRDWGQSLPIYSTKNVAFHANDSGRSSAILNTEILGCRGDGPGCFSFFWYNTQESRVCWNYFRNTMNSVPGISPETGSLQNNVQDGRLIGVYSGSGGLVNHDVIGNVSWTPEGAVRRGYMLDVINFGGGSVGNQESERIFVLRNWLIGSGISDADHEGSGFGIIVEQTPVAATNGYFTGQFNILTRTINGGLQYGNARNILYQYNDLFCPAVADDCTDNGVALNPGGAGSNNYMRYNNLLYYQWNPGGNLVLSHVWMPPSSTHTPTGLYTDNPTITEWDNGAGQDLVDKRHVILNNPGYDHGIDCMFAHYDTPAGNGVLFWEDGAGSGIGQLSFAAYGDTYGTPVDIIGASGQTGIGDWDKWYDIESGDYLGLRVIIDPTTLAAVGADKYYPVKVTAGLPTDFHIPPYDQDLGYDITDAFIGEWAGTETVTGSAPVNTPAVPTTFSDTPGAGSITFTWDDMSGSGATSYRLYEDGGLVASPGSGDYTGYVHIPPNGSTYSYQLASADDTASPVLISGKTAPIDSALTSGYTPLEDWDHGDWSTSNLSSVVDQGDGTWLFTNGPTATTGAKIQNISGLTPGNTYRVRFQHKNGTATGRFVALDYTAGYDWSVPVGHGYIAKTLDDTTLTQKEYDVTLTSQYLTLVFWEASATVGKTTYYSVPTLDDTT